MPYFEISQVDGGQATVYRWRLLQGSPENPGNAIAVQPPSGCLTEQACRSNIHEAKKLMSASRRSKVVTVDG